MSMGGFIRRTLFWSFDFLKGRKIREHFDDLKIVLKDYETGKNIQKKHLNELLKYVTENTIFYKDYHKRPLNEFPIVNKLILNENRDLIMVEPEKIPYQNGKTVHIQKTSGSTGTPFSVPQDVRKRNRRIAELKYFNEIIGFKSHEKLGQCRIWTKWQSKSKWQSFRENIIPINVSQMDDKTIEFILKTVKKEKIVSLRAYASWYDVLVNYIDSDRTWIDCLKTLKVCVSSSEALKEETRQKMLELTGVPIVECYANEENGMLAQQKINDENYYLNHSGYFFEFLKLESDEPAEYGENARIVITDLFNYAFPIIRYDTGDVAIFEKGTLKSNGWFYISKLYGRRLDLVYNAVGDPIHPMNFARVLKNIPGIKQWQFIQKDKERYVLKLLVIDEFPMEKYVIDEILKIVGENADVTIEYVNEIPVLASGKRKSVVCEWKKV